MGRTAIERLQCAGHTQYLNNYCRYILHMTFTVNVNPASCERCGLNAQFNWDGINVCGSGCYELLVLAKNKHGKEWLQIQVAKLIGSSQQEVQDAIGNVISEDESIKIPASTYSRYYPQSENWVIQLNKYHRDNLLWLFNVIGYPGAGIKPFTFANTGDWNGEIPLMLCKPGQSNPVLDAKDRPNKSIDALKSDIEYWLKKPY